MTHGYPVSWKIEHEIYHMVEYEINKWHFSVKHAVQSVSNKEKIFGSGNQVTLSPWRVPRRHFKFLCLMWTGKTLSGVCGGLWALILPLHLLSQSLRGNFKKNKMSAYIYGWQGTLNWLKSHGWASKLQKDITLFGFSAAVYHIWKERNMRQYQQTSKSAEEIIKDTLENIC